MTERNRWVYTLRGIRSKLSTVPSNKSGALEGPSPVVKGFRSITANLSPTRRLGRSSDNAHSASRFPNVSGFIKSKLSPPQSAGSFLKTKFDKPETRHKSISVNALAADSVDQGPSPSSSLRSQSSERESVPQPSPLKTAPLASFGRGQALEKGVLDLGSIMDTSSISSGSRRSRELNLFGNDINDSAPMVQVPQGSYDLLSGSMSAEASRIAGSSPPDGSRANSIEPRPGGSGSGSSYDADGAI
jgi:hypothetical protein